MHKAMNHSNVSKSNEIYVEPTNLTENSMELCYFPIRFSAILLFSSTKIKY